MEEGSSCKILSCHPAQVDFAAKETRKKTGKETRKKKLRLRWFLNPRNLKITSCAERIEQFVGEDLVPFQIYCKTTKFHYWDDIEEEDISDHRANFYITMANRNRNEECIGSEKEDEEDIGKEIEVSFGADFEEKWQIYGNREPILIAKATNSSVGRVYFTGSTTIARIEFEGWLDTFLLGSSISGWLMFLKPNMRDVFLQHIGSGEQVPLPSLPSRCCPSHSDVLGMWKADIIGEPGVGDLNIIMIGYLRQDPYAMKDSLVVLSYRIGLVSWEMSSCPKNFTPIICGPMQITTRNNDRLIVWMERGNAIQCIVGNLGFNNQPTRIPLPQANFRANDKTSMVSHGASETLIVFQGAQSSQDRPKWGLIHWVHLRAGISMFYTRERFEEELYLKEGGRGYTFGENTDTSCMASFMFAERNINHLSRSSVMEDETLWVSGDLCNEDCACSMAWILRLSWS